MKSKKKLIGIVIVACLVGLISYAYLFLSSLDNSFMVDRSIDPSSDKAKYYMKYFGISKMLSEIYDLRLTRSAGKDVMLYCSFTLPKDKFEQFIKDKKWEDNTEELFYEYGYGWIFKISPDWWTFEKKILWCVSERGKGEILWVIDKKNNIIYGASW